MAPCIDGDSGVQRSPSSPIPRPKSLPPMVGVQHFSGQSGEWLAMTSKFMSIFRARRSPIIASLGDLRADLLSHEFGNIVDVARLMRSRYTSGD